MYIREYNVQTGWSNGPDLGNDINTRHWESLIFSVNNDVIFVSNRPGVLEKVIFGEQKLLEINFLTLKI